MKKKATSKAIALEYDGKNAPFVSASGQGKTADEIIAIAKKHCVPIVEHPDLASAISTLNLGEEIPEMLYLAIADIIAFVYRVQQSDLKPE